MVEDLLEFIKEHLKIKKIFGGESPKPPEQSVPALRRFGSEIVGPQMSTQVRLSPPPPSHMQIYSYAYSPKKMSTSEGRRLKMLFRLGHLKNTSGLSFDWSSFFGSHLS